MATPAAPRVVVVGEALVDDLPPASAGEGRRLLPGGAPVNVAVALGRLGVPVAFAGPIGSDEAGDILIWHLVGSDVELLLPRSESRTGRALVTLDDTGHPSYDFELDGTAASEVNVEAADVGASSALALVAGAMGFADAPLGTSLATLIRDAVVPVWLDPNIRPRVLGTDAAGRREYAVLIDELVRHATVCKASDEDLRLLHGEDVDVLAAAQAWAASGPALVVLTRGGDGLTAIRPSGETVEVSAVLLGEDERAGGDTVGAGDTVTAALIAWAWEHGCLDREALSALADEDVAEALRFAAAAAAVTVTRAGADPPRREALP